MKRLIINYRFAFLAIFSFVLGKLEFVCPAGDGVRPLASRKRSGGSSAELVTEQYKIPEDILELFKKHGFPKREEKSDSQSRNPLKDRPTSLFNEKLGVLIVRDTKEEQDKKKAYVQKLWKWHFQELAKKNN